MKTNEEINQLLQTILKRDHNSYKILYETVSSALDKLSSSWSENSHDITDAELADYSRFLKRLSITMNGIDSTIEYEAGKLCGIIDAFERLYDREKESLEIDAAMANLLSRSKPSSKHVLHILYESRNDYEWTPTASLEKKCSLSSTSLSNIMKRLVQAQAVAFQKEGRNVRYRLSPAGKRYYEQKILPANNALNQNQYVVASELTSYMIDLRDQISVLQQQLKRQSVSIKHLEETLPTYITKSNWLAEKNTASQPSLDELSYSKFNFEHLKISNKPTTVF